MALKQKDISFIEACDAIRDAHQRGKKVVTLKDGHTYDITKQVRNVRYSTGGVSNRPMLLHTAKEVWLVATRVDGALTPVYSVELKPDSNRRTRQ